MGQDQEKLTSIQVLRALAALGVVVFHVVAEINTLGAGYPEFSIGMAGVDLFFVISGFVMVTSSDRLFGQRGASAEFITRRLIRIVPLYWVVSSILLAHALLRPADLASMDMTWGGLLASFVFVPYPRPSGEFTPLLKLGWTLNYEMFFYVLFAAALAFRRTIALLLVVSVVLAISIASVVAWPDVPMIHVWPAPIIAEFTFGVLVGWARLSGFRIPVLLAAILLASGIAAMVASQVLGFTEPRVLVWGIPSVLMVASVSLASLEGRGAVWRAAVKLGDASYALYLIHLFMIFPRLVWQRFLGPDGPWMWSLAGYAMVSVAASVAVALVIHRCFEAPITQWLKAALSRFIQTARIPLPGSNQQHTSPSLSEASRRMT